MVRISGDEASILATIEIVKVILVAVTVSILATLDNVWCMYMLRKHGEVVMYKTDIGHFASKAFRTMWDFLISVGTRAQTVERERIMSLRCREKSASKVKISPLSLYRSVRTILLFAGILLSVAEVIVLFALTTEGKDVADKPEFDVRFEEAAEVSNGSTMQWFIAHEAQIQYEYVVRRLRRRIEFMDGNEFKVQVPRRLDVMKDEKWPYTVRLADEEVYATVYVRDFISQEKAQFSENRGQVTELTESGMRLRQYNMAQKDKNREACSGTKMGAGMVHKKNGSGILCYTEKLQDKSCADMKQGNTVSFSMKCSEVRVKRFGEHGFPDPIWWLTEYASGTNGDGSEGILQLVWLRYQRGDDISPSAMILAALLTEYSSQKSPVRRDVAVNVGVVVVPNWLSIATAVLVAIELLLGGLALAYATTKNLVNLTNWEEMYIANLIDPLACLNRLGKKEFRCVVSQGWNVGHKYQLFVEPGDSIDPISCVTRKEIGTVDLIADKS